MKDKGNTLTFPDGMPPHQIEAIKRGGSAHFEGEVYTLASLGVDPAQTANAVVDYAVRIAELQAENAELRKKLDEPRPGKVETQKAEAIEDDLTGVALKDLRPIAAALDLNFPTVGVKGDDVREAIRAKRAEKAEGGE